MPNEQKRIRIDLTREQQAFVKEKTGVDVPSVELTADELEQRIAPTSLTFGGPHVTYGQQ